jgi:RNA polymerase primary sigma factor
MRHRTTNDSPSLARYLSEIRCRPKLSREDEAGLARRAREGSGRALNDLVEANLGFVVKIAHEYRDMGLPFEDLLNEGNLGLIRAARRFDSARGTKFITFAVWWIRKSILAALSQNAGLVRIPDHHRRRLRRIRQTEQSLVRELGRSPRREEVAEALAHGPAEMDAALLHDLKGRSLGEAVGRDRDTPLSELLADETASTGEEDYLRREATELVAEALHELDPRQRRVLEYRFGLSGGPALVLREAGRRLGLSRERVRQIEVSATRRLRRILLRRLSAGPQTPRHQPLRRAGQSRAARAGNRTASQPSWAAQRVDASGLVLGEPGRSRVRRGVPRHEDLARTTSWGRLPFPLQRTGE